MLQVDMIRSLCKVLVLYNVYTESGTKTRRNAFVMRSLLTICRVALLSPSMALISAPRCYCGSMVIRRRLIIWKEISEIEFSKSTVSTLLCLETFIRL